MSGLIGKKVGMTSIFDENGKNIPCTVIEAGPCVVTQVRTKEVDGYEALRLVSMTRQKNVLTKPKSVTLKKQVLLPLKKLLNSKNLKESTN